MYNLYIFLFCVIIVLVFKGGFFMKPIKKWKKIALLAGFGVILSGCEKEEQTEFISIEDFAEDFLEEEPIKEIEETMVEEPEINKVDITISAIGDCTLGTDTNFDYEDSFTNVLDNNNRNFSYFFDGVYEILANDDLTIANLETTFTDADKNYRVDKKFNFKGAADYTNILTEGSVEAVNLANNHTHDYGEKGYNDTITNLENAGIPYFGYENYKIMEIEGKKIGLAGLTGWNEETAKQETDKAINYFHENQTDLIIMTYHWGIEREYNQNAGQVTIARYAIDQGADLVLGHHPHVLQGIEYYNGKYIVYSLGNFVFGGNRNPSDKDTMIFQETFHYENGILISTSINIIPCSLSSRKDLNDYQPTLLEGEEQEQVLKKVLKASTNLDYQD